MTRETGKRPRRTHSREFKIETVALVRTGGRSVAQVAEELDLADSVNRRCQPAHQGA
jgi:transposase-like protein